MKEERCDLLKDIKEKSAYLIKDKGLRGILVKTPVELEVVIHAIVWEQTVARVTVNRYRTLALVVRQPERERESTLSTITRSLGHSPSSLDRLCHQISNMSTNMIYIFLSK